MMLRLIVGKDDSIMVIDLVHGTHGGAPCWYTPGAHPSMMDPEAYVAELEARAAFVRQSMDVLRRRAAAKAGA